RNGSVGPLTGISPRDRETERGALLMPPMEELLLEVGPKLRHEIACYSPQEGRLDPACHYGSSHAAGRVVQIRSSDAHDHAENSGYIERRLTGILPRNHQTADGIDCAPRNPGLWAPPEVSGILVKYIGYQSRAEQALRPEIPNSRAKPFSIGG